MSRNADSEVEYAIRCKQKLLEKLGTELDELTLSAKKSEETWPIDREQVIARAEKAV